MGESKAFPGVVRKLWPNERDAFLEHLLRLDPASRRDRFGLTVSDEFLRTYAETTFGLGGFVFGYVEDGMIRGASELRGLEDLATDSAEAAFSVEKGWRRRGIGEALFRALIISARNHGHGRLLMTCLRSNEAMKALARKFSAEVAIDIDSANGLLDAGHPTPLTIFDEAVDDMKSFAMLSLDLQRRFLKRRLWPRALWQKSLLQKPSIPADTALPLARERRKIG